MAALVSRVDAVKSDSIHEDGLIRKSSSSTGNDSHIKRAGGSGDDSGSTKASLYVKASKGLVFPYISTPRLDVVYTLVLIAYNEFADARHPALWAWSGMAIRIVVCLDRFVSLTTGRKTSISEQDVATLGWLDSGNPTLLQTPSAATEVHIPFHYLCRLMVIAGRISNLLKGARFQEQYAHTARPLSEYADVLAKFHAQLPMELYFDICNFQQALRLQPLF
ncbi:hypothetical protein SPI_07520 [Niveomyces insectorum RCEF 264]|uniref:Uncharacterized protein n=1 Tax=Niveomyces insectorum RCEF 264 TaxID=1081102 RepID=A0A167PY96_9HYPO|nr:hypothetical protein SPI_07520 [Niveomyces insectorum RCEF 264]